ncbi:hypothetical protein ACTQ32_13220 [Roseburia faecis]|uniref:hypothetical protein n=1 Tax=Roseburia faecis TaxID=301302 RepID=UPI003F97C26A
MKLPEPVFHCVNIFHHQPDNIDVPAGIPAHEELSGCFSKRGLTPLKKYKLF